jgi:hypothetical protein
VATKAIELKKKSRLLEGKTLKSFGACPSQRRKFTRMFGKSVRVTVKRVLAAEAKELDVSYLQVLMSPEADTAYEKATRKLYSSGGFARRIAALKRKFKYGNLDWYESFSQDRRTKFYAAEAIVDGEYSKACTELMALYWINDPKPRTERDPDDCGY